MDTANLGPEDHGGGSDPHDPRGQGPTRASDPRPPWASRPCELCGGPGALYDAHGWYCQPCRDQDPGDDVPDVADVLADGPYCPACDAQPCEAADHRQPDDDRDRIEDEPPGTTYRLGCGHLAGVPGPAGATSGRAWCATCDESAEALHVVPAGVTG